MPPDTPVDLAELITGLVQNDRDARWPQTAAEALALLRGHGQPVASPEELAALVGPALSRRDQELADMRPADVLPPGHVLAPRMTGPLVARAVGHAAGDAPAAAADAPPALAAGGAAAAPPVLVAGNAGDARPVPARAGAADAPARRVTGSGDHAPPDLAALFPELMAQLRAELAADELPDLVTERASDAVPEHVTDAPAVSIPRNASRGMLRESSRTAGRLAVRHAVSAVAIGACLVLGSLLDDGFRCAPTPVTPALPIEVSVPVTAPGPAHPVAPAPVTPEQPRHAAERTDGPQRERAGLGHRTGPRASRWRSAPRVREPPPWGLR